MYNPATGHLCFSEALAYLKRNQPIRRAHWAADQGLWLLNGQLLLASPWTPSSDAVLAEDWVPLLTTSTQQRTTK